MASGWIELFGGLSPDMHHGLVAIPRRWVDRPQTIPAAELAGCGPPRPEAGPTPRRPAPSFASVVVAAERGDSGGQEWVLTPRRSPPERKTIDAVLSADPQAGLAPGVAVITAAADAARVPWTEGSEGAQ